MRPVCRVADMCSEVIAPTARRPARRSPQSAVNNFAATRFAPVDKSSSGRIAPRPRRSSVAQPARLQLRTSPGVAARPQTSERTSPHESPDISTTRSRPTMHGKKNPMHAFEQLTHFAGFDWAKDHHDAVIVDRQGATVASLTWRRSRITTWPLLMRGQGHPCWVCLSATIRLSCMALRR